MPDDVSSSEPFGDFPTTHWSLVAAAQSHGEQSAAAYNGLLSRYWKPVFYYVRARGRSLEIAEDLTQEFFFRFLERDWIRKVDPERGRFRAFLLTLLKHFLSDMGPNRVARQRRFEAGLVSVSTLLSDEDRCFEPPTDESAESIFLQQWASELLERVRRETRRVCEAEGRLLWYELLEAGVLADDAGTSGTQPELARRFGVTRDQVRYGLEQGKARFERLLRSELRSEGADELEIEDEIRELLRIW
jgi:RNA polymerase sigma-70 factor (ECF subfamily)